MDKIKNLILFKTHHDHELFLQNYDIIKKSLEKENQIFVISSNKLEKNIDYYLLNSGLNKLPINPFTLGRPYYWYNGHYGILDFIYNYKNIEYDYVWSIEWDLFSNNWADYINYHNNMEEDFLSCEINCFDETALKNISYVNPVKVREGYVTPTIADAWGWWEYKDIYNVKQKQFEYCCNFEITRFSKKYAEFLLEETKEGIYGQCEYLVPTVAINNNFKVNTLKNKTNIILQNGFR